MIRICITLLGLMLLGGCAGKNTFNDLRVSLGLDSAYHAAVVAFNQGQVMEARERLLSIKKEDPDYAKAQSFVKDKVEPARLKLLSYYSHKGEREEKNNHWAKAEEAYQTAATLSAQPQALKKRQASMNLKVRQLRVDTLYKQRKKEDENWLNWKTSYEPPQGLIYDDEAFLKVSNDLNKNLETRLAQTWALAQYYRDKDAPELAWLYADAYLRLSPDIKKAQDLKNAMATALPKGFVLPQEDKKVEGTQEVKTVRVVKTQGSVKNVRRLMNQAKWLEARQGALILRKEGNADAEKLLETIDTQIKKHAEKSYIDGNLAFRLERIDEAVVFWQQAVNWMPHEQIYVNSLRRGKQIQERLAALKSDAKE